MKIRKDLMANDDCTFCGLDCGHYFEGKIRQYKKGRFNFEYVVDEKTKNVIIFNTCDAPFWICKECFEELFLKGGKNEVKAKNNIGM